MAVNTMINSPTYGRFAFDAVFNTQHDMNVTVTQHPVQTGASIADHAFTNPYEVSCEIGMTDVAKGVGNDHSVNAFAQLVAIMERKEPVTLITRLKTYPNMLITSVSAPDDYTTMHAMKASVYFRRINIVKVSTVKVQITVTASQSASATGSTGGENPTPTQPATTGGGSTPATTGGGSSGGNSSVLWRMFKGSDAQSTTKAAGAASSSVRDRAASLLGLG